MGKAPSQYCEDLKDGLQQEQELVKRRKKKVVLYKEKNETMWILKPIDFLHLIRDIEEMGFTEADKYDGTKDKLLDKDKLLSKLLLCLFS